MNIVDIPSACYYLKQEKVIAYPTESIFGLGCDPDSEKAILDLYKMKNRGLNKAYILVAADFSQILPYIDEQKLTENHKVQLKATWPGPITWILPKNSLYKNVIMHSFSTIAIRISAHPLIVSLCRQFQKPIVSTSANISFKKPAKTQKEVFNQFGNIPIVQGHLGNLKNPTEIREIISGKIIRENE